MTYHQVFDGLLASDYYHQHNVFSGTGFIPYNPFESVKTTKLNLFNGFQFTVDESLVDRQCDLYDYFDQNFTCEKESNYARQWLAACIQNPKRRLPVMILYSEEQGTGKSTLQNIIARIFEGYVLSVSDIGKSILGSFNSQLANKLIINCSEVQSSEGGQRVSISQNEVLKSLITETKLPIREKFVNEYEVDFYGKFVISCNYADAIRITKEDRRFSILDFGAQNKGNSNYFKNINKALEDDDQIQILFNKLLFLDISDFDPTRPITDTKITSIAYKTNLPVALKFIYNFVNAESFSKNLMGSQNKVNWEAGTFNIKMGDLYSAYERFTSQAGISHVQTLAAFGKTLSGLKLADGTPVCNSRKSGGYMFRMFTRDDVNTAVQVQLGSSDEELLDELLI